MSYFSSASPSSDRWARWSASSRATPATSFCPRARRCAPPQANMQRFEGQRAQLEARNLEQKKEAEGVAAKLDGQTFVVIRSASDGGGLYGSVTTRDASDAAIAAGFSLDRRQVVLENPIKALGLHPLEVRSAPRGRGDDHDQRRAQRRGGRHAGLRQDDPGTAGRGGRRSRVRHRRALRRHRLRRR